MIHQHRGRSYCELATPRCCYGDRGGQTASSHQWDNVFALFLVCVVEHGLTAGTAVFICLAREETNNQLLSKISNFFRFLSFPLHLAHGFK